MTSEKVLAYRRDIAPQEKYWDCGPASCQIVLDARGITASEDQLIAEIGTTVNGTDYVGLIERVLDKRIPDARYTSIYIDNDPPTWGQRDTLWQHLTRSIDAGFGVIANWVSPPSNRPIGIKGSATPNYRGTIYHYVAAMGYDTSPRAVWIADPGFAPFGYWVSFDNFATLIPPKGYAYADTAAAPAAPVAPVADILAKAMGGSVPFDRYRALAPAVTESLKACNATTIDRIAMWCAQIGHESGGLRWMEEISDGSAYEGRTDLGNTQPGDGRRYKGRGPIQVTGRHNYTQLSRWAHTNSLVPTSTFFADSPEKLASDRYGFLGVTWYWTVARPQLNALADARDLDAATRAINGGLNGIADRRDRYTRALALGNQLLTLLDTTTTTGDDDMAAVPQEQWDRVYRELTQRLPSRSIYRHPGEGVVDTAAGMLLNIDAMQHAELVERLARLGDRDAVARVARTAAGQGAVTDPQAIAQAATVLADIERTNPTILQEFLTKGAR
ncbi:MAG: C39 family peptidase [Mycobacterium sp.]|nr:C39 family peptidase [Mycobacterium sp.]